MLENLKANADVNQPACDATLSRKEFLTKLVQRAAVAGSLIAAPQIVDKFLVPPAQALSSTTSAHDSTNAHDQTQHFHDSHAPFRNPSNHGGGSHGGAHGNGFDSSPSGGNSPGNPSRHRGGKNVPTQTWDEDDNGGWG